MQTIVVAEHRDCWINSKGRQLFCTILTMSPNLRKTRMTFLSKWMFIYFQYQVITKSRWYICFIIRDDYDMPKMETVSSYADYWIIAAVKQRRILNTISPCFDWKLPCRSSWIEAGLLWMNINLHTCANWKMLGVGRFVTGCFRHTHSCQGLYLRFNGGITFTLDPLHKSHFDQKCIYELQINKLICFQDMFQIKNYKWEVKLNEICTQMSLCHSFSFMLKKFVSTVGKY